MCAGSPPVTFGACKRRRTHGSSLPRTALGRHRHDPVCRADATSPTMPLPSRVYPVRLIQGYFWLSPILFLVSWRFGFDIRIPFLDQVPGARATYYALTTGC